MNAKRRKRGIWRNQQIYQEHRPRTSPTSTPMTSSGLKPFVVSGSLIHPEAKGSKQVGRDRMLKGADVFVSTCSVLLRAPGGVTVKHPAESLFYGLRTHLRIYSSPVCLKMHEPLVISCPITHKVAGGITREGWQKIITAKTWSSFWTANYWWRMPDRREQNVQTATSLLPNTHSRIHMEEEEEGADGQHDHRNLGGNGGTERERGIVMKPFPTCTGFRSLKSIWTPPTASVQAAATTMFEAHDVVR